MKANNIGFQDTLTDEDSKGLICGANYRWQELCNEVASPIPLLPPFTEDTARAKVKRAENLWNTKDPIAVSLAYTEDSVWRNRHEFLQGRKAIVEFLSRKWEKELGYSLKKDLFLFASDRIAVQFEYTWHDTTGKQYRSYGLEHWEFAPNGLMKKRAASINDTVCERFLG